MSKIEILKMISIPAGAWSRQDFFVLNRMPEFKYEEIKKNGRHYLLGEDNGFYDCLYFEHDSYAKAFGGRTLNLEMKDGSTLISKGEWWSGGHGNIIDKPLKQMGIGTEESLKKCFVFCSAVIDGEIFGEFIRKNPEPDSYSEYRDYINGNSSHKLN